MNSSLQASVVITGIGLITPLGRDPKTLVQRLQRGETAAQTPDRFDPAPFLCPLSAQVAGFDPEAVIGDAKTLRLMNSDAIFAVAAARLALEDAKAVIGTDYRPEEVALFGSTGLAGIALEEVAPLIKFSAGEAGAFDPKLFGSQALRQVRPTLSFKILSNMPICFVSIFENIQGPNGVFNPWEGQGALAMINGIESIRSGHAKAALVGGCDVKAHELSFISLQQQGVFSSWATEGKGCIPGEGGAFLFLEEETRARARNARIYARIADFAVSSGDIRNPTRQLPELLEKVFPKGSALRIPLVAAADGTPVFGLREEEAIGMLRENLTGMLFPKQNMGNLFAAAAPAQLAIGAWLTSAEEGGKGCLVNCFGHGDVQAAFRLEPAAGTPPIAAPVVSSGSSKTGPRNRVVVTGLGVVSPVGNDRDSFWKNLTAGVSGTAPITLFDASALTVRIGGEVKGFDPATLRAAFPEAAHERDRKVWLGLSAAMEALQDAGLRPDKPGLVDLSGLFLNVGVSLEVFFLQDVTPFTGGEFSSGKLANGILKVSPPPPPLQTPLDRMTSLLARRFGLKGRCATNCSACAAGAQVIGEAFLQVRSGLTDMALAGAADSMLNPLGMGGFSLLRALSMSNDNPAKACRPFDAARDGAVLGEGGGFLVLESLEHAMKRGAKIYAEILGYGSSADAYRVSDPEPGGRGAVLSMRNALSDARLSPEEIDCVNAHGTGTPKNDVVETLAIKEILGKRARQIPVHSVKSMTGHMIAASGAVETVAAALTIFRGVVPPTINLEKPDPDCDLDYVPGTARPFTGRTVLTNSFAFGGQNATLILGAMTKGETAVD